MLNTRHRAPLALALLLAFTGLAQANEPSVQSDSRQLTAGRDAAAYSVRISYPDGRVAETQLLAGESMPIDAASPGGLLADGQYNYEFVPITGVMRRGINDVPRAGERLRASQPARSGTFRVVGGRVIAPEQQPISITDQDYGVSLKHQLPAADGNRSAMAKDQVIADDLIVQSSICVGFDCVNGENFGFDTLRLKENNTRINFEDTSTGTFPSSDWTLVANDSASGGANYFAIEDRNNARQIFRATAGAPANALFIDSTGRIGLRTSTPVLDMHISTSNTPGMRLEQNSAGGFTAQTWDVAGNEANFFIRDVTGGSRLPFRIQPGAPSNSLYISTAGNVGMGTASPAGSGFESLFLEIKSAKPALVLDNAGGANQFSEVLLQNNNVNAWSFGNTTNDGRFYFYNYGRNAYDLNINNSNGYIGLGGVTVPTNPIQHSSGAVLTASGVWQNASSRALKDEILELPADAAMAALKAMVPVTFRYRADPGDLNVGFIAEEVPELVATASHKTLSAMDIVGVLTRVEQAQQAQIEHLSKELDALKSQGSVEK